MDSVEFKINAEKLIEYMIEYLETIETRPVFPDVKPGYVHELLPKDAPTEPEKFDKVLEDIESVIMQGVTHWIHPQFHAYFGSANAYPSALADIVSGMFGILAFSWAASPAATELEHIVLDWLAKALGFPKDFWFHEGGNGGGVIQGSASECIFICMLAARAQAIKYIKEKEQTPDVENNTLLPKLVAYTSIDSHSCVEKAAVVNMVEIRLLESDSKCELKGETVEKAIEEDIKNGLVPFFVCATLGTTGMASFDDVAGIGEVCKKYPSVWFHVDGAHSGNALICPEFRYLINGIENVHSINVSPNKWMKIAFDIGCMWVRDRTKLQEGLVVDPLYLKHRHEQDTIDYRHWSVQLSRRFRSMKIWFTLVAYGVEGLQAYIRNHCEVAKHLESLIKEDSRFEVVNDVRASLVCFRLKGSNELNEDLLAFCNASREIHMVPVMVKGQFTIRLNVSAPNIKKTDIEKSWGIIKTHAEKAIELQSTPHETPEEFTFHHYIDKYTSKCLMQHISLFSNPFLNDVTSSNNINI